MITSIWTTLADNNYKYVYYFALTNELVTYKKRPKGKNWKLYMSFKGKHKPKDLLIGKLEYVGAL